MASMYSSPIIMSVAGDSPVMRSATGFLLRIDTHTFLITNSHVMQCYRDMMRDRGSVKFKFGGTEFVPIVVDEKIDDDRIDLAVINASDLTFERHNPGYWRSASSYLEPYAPRSWPMAPPKKGEATAVVGWPGKFRTQPATNETEFAAFPLIGHFIDAVDESRFLLPFNRDEMVGSDWDPDNPAVFEKALGGMSGTPVFALHREGVQPLQLVGIVHAYGEGLDVLYCTRADLVQPDGTIQMAAE